MVDIAGMRADGYQDHRKKWRGLVNAFVSVGTVLAVVGSLGIGTATADTAPTVPTIPRTVSADALPTVQVDGVVWAQIVVGNTVYVTGKFANARPAGAAPGTNLVPRSNALAYDLDTGELKPWAPALNGQGRALEASADGKTVFVGGDFTNVSGVNRYRLAAVDADNGTVLNIFTAALDAGVRALEVQGDTLYVGGIFNTVGGQARQRLAAFNVATGAALPWAPKANAEVMAITAPPGSNKVVVGGRFTTLNGANNVGVGSLDATSGATISFPTNTVVRNSGINSAIYSLSSDAGTVYGTGYSYGSGNLESVFASDVATGNLRWVSGCRGDTYSNVTIGDVMYVAGHPHDCSQIGGLPQTEPWSYQWSLAFRTNASGPINSSGNFLGKPAPELLHWLPTLAPGTFTGQKQAGWSIAGNDRYIVLGGEFPKVNGVPQEGLVRFAIKDQAPNKEAPNGYNELLPAMTGVGPGAVRATWTAAWDRDNSHLTYELLRGAQLSTATVAATTANDAQWWNRGRMGATDTSAPPGSTQTYRVRVTDAFGNTMVGPTATATVPAGIASPPSAYQELVARDGAVHYWRLGEASGTLASDWAGDADLTLKSAQRNVGGAIVGDRNPSTSFTAGSKTGGSAQFGPQSFSAEAWFNTTTRWGGKIIGFGSVNTNNSASSDRHVYMSNSGQLLLGANANGFRTVASPRSYNDGKWHHVVGVLGSTGMRLYVDGEQVAERADTVQAEYRTAGYWRVGGDSLGGWPSAPLSSNISGALDEVAVYNSALSSDAVQAHWQRGQGVVANQPPVAAFTETVTDLAVAFDGSTSADPDGTIVSYEWNFGDDATGATITGADAKIDHSYAVAGTYAVTLTVVDNSGAKSTATHPVTVKDAVVPADGEVAKDSFDRETVSGLGEAEVGGVWSVTGGGAKASVESGSAKVTVPAGRSATMLLPAVASGDVDMSHSMWLEAMPTGGGAYLSTVLRSGASGDYRSRVRILADGSVQVSLTKVVAGTETVLGSVVTLPGLTYTAGKHLRVRAQVLGASPSTLQVKVWDEEMPEPVQWTRSVTDSTPELQALGSTGLAVYISGSSTEPVVARFDNFEVARPE
ncbi:LamG-like jellyroll fold domain-containing protein [Rhodococcus erythropolis]|uniref:LamG-like jellyroll fold domain-containing protein n=1 Tax=Rhodococcus erythropolis TaxID=1833 RepID=UPI0022B5AF49|nr:LamG-like jellyroll fold domain-containing protein [Rhodococcus erythropolis]MCZ4567315.1 PKD domain-containing protein [Rhodococcus erythropolis]